MQIEYKSSELMDEQRLIIFTDMYFRVRENGVGVEQVWQYVLLFEGRPNKETRIADCFRSFMHLLVRNLFSFHNLRIIAKLRF